MRFRACHIAAPPNSFRLLSIPPRRFLKRCMKIRQQLLDSSLYSSRWWWHYLACTPPLLHTYHAFWRFAAFCISRQSRQPLFHRIIGVPHAEASSDIAARVYCRWYRHWLYSAQSHASFISPHYSASISISKPLSWRPSHMRQCYFIRTESKPQRLAVADEPLGHSISQECLAET